MHVSTGSLHIKLFVRKGTREERRTEVWERVISVNLNKNSKWSINIESRKRMGKSNLVPRDQETTGPSDENDLDPKNPLLLVVLRMPQFLTDRSSLRIFQSRPQCLPTRQNVYACARLSISGLFFSHTFQSDQNLPRAPCVLWCSVWFSCSASCCPCL